MIELIILAATLVALYVLGGVVLAIGITIGAIVESSREHWQYNTRNWHWLPGRRHGKA